MPLQDHFRPPLSLRRHWHAFHNAWATYLASDLNATLPAGYFAEPNVQFGIEIDVAAFEEQPAGSRGGTAVWTAPAPTVTLPLTLLTDTVEIQIFSQEGGPVLAGAVELVSPANKDRPAHRDAFVSKCAAYLQQGIGLMCVDVVTDRRADLHGELLARLGSGDRARALDLYAAAYGPTRRGTEPLLDIWLEPLQLGSKLPTLPLLLRGGPPIPVDLEAGYDRTCREQRLQA